MNCRQLCVGCAQYLEFSRSSSTGGAFHSLSPSLEHQAFLSCCRVMKWQSICPKQVSRQLS